MKKGQYFSKDELKYSKEKAVFSNTFLGEKVLDIKNSDGTNEIINFDNINISYEKEPKITISKELFKDYGSGINFNDPSLKIILSGESKDLENAIKNINEYLGSKSIVMKVYDYMIYDRGVEWKALIKTTILIIFVTFINSIGIAYLWVQSRKKEIILRKVVGAFNFELGKLFFIDLLKIAAISMVIAIFIQGILAFANNGYILDMCIKLNFINIISSFIVTIGTTLITSIPFLIYLFKIQPVKMLRED